MSEKLVSGPISTIRLEGSINGIKKVVYLFGDYHIHPNFQKECENMRNINIQEYFVSTYDSAKKVSDKMYDLFIERDPLTPHFTNPKYQGRYLDVMINLFYKTYKFDFKKKKALPSEELQNVRIHYMDARGWIMGELIDIVYKLNSTIGRIDCNMNIDLDELLIFKDTLTIVYSHMVYLYQILYNTETYKKEKLKGYPLSLYGTLLTNIPNSEYKKIINNFVKKIYERYQHKEVKDKILNIINSEIKPRFNKVLKDIYNFNEEFNKTVNFLSQYEGDLSDYLIKQSDGTYQYGISKDYALEIITPMVNISNTVFQYIIGDIMGLHLMDLYSMRRLLDKDYVTHAQAYTGAAHTMNYVRYLIKYFDFKITHTSYISNKDTDFIEDKIKKSKIYKELFKFFLPPQFGQCSDLTNFPNNFE